MVFVSIKHQVGFCHDHPQPDWTPLYPRLSAGASGKWAGRWEAEGLCGCTGEISPSGAVPGACEHGSPTRVQSIRSTPEPSGNLAALRACAQAELDAMPNDTTLAGNLAVRRLCQAIMRTTPEPGENHAALIKELEGAAYDWGGAEPKYHHSLMMRAAKALCSCRYCSTPTKSAKPEES
jgi:hypothetical protein